MSDTRLVDDCFQASEELMRHETALDVLRTKTQVVVGTETVPLENAGDRIVSEPIVARLNVPGHNNAAVDGFAFRFDDIDPSGDTELTVAGRSAAGDPFTETVQPKHAARILTGAVVPDGCDSIVMQEDVDVDADGRRVRLPASVRRGANIRPAGEDVRHGDVVFGPGARIRAPDLAALASIGCDPVPCYRKLKVGIISTGDEIVEPGTQSLKPGQVFDANTGMLVHLARTLGYDVQPLGIWPDDPVLVETRLREAAKTQDVLITSGGASQGDEDHIAKALGRLGQRHFWRIAVKPGRPLMFGQVSRVPVIGLPGNPVAVFVCFLMYVSPVLSALAGGGFREPRRYMLPSGFDITRRKPGRREFWRGSVCMKDNQTAFVEKFQKDGSGLISSLRLSNGLIDVPEGVDDIKVGDAISFIPYSEFGIVA